MNETANAKTQSQHYGNAGCIVKKQNHMLVAKLRKIGKWDIPAGRPLPHEIAAKTAERETWEETGVKIKVVRFLTLIKAPKGESLYVYQAVPLDQDLALNMPLQISNQFKEEIIEARFLPIHDLNEGNFRYPSLLPQIIDLFHAID